MNLKDAIVEFRYSKDWTKQTSAWYERRLRPFVEWCTTQGVRDLEGITPPIVRRYIEYLKTRPAKRSES
jgi:site-specific recombinase XerD